MHYLCKELDKCVHTAGVEHLFIIENTVLMRLLIWTATCSTHQREADLTSSFVDLRNTGQDSQNSPRLLLNSPRPGCFPTSTRGLPFVPILKLAMGQPEPAS